MWSSATTDPNNVERKVGSPSLAIGDEEKSFAPTERMSFTAMALPINAQRSIETLASTTYP